MFMGRLAFQTRAVILVILGTAIAAYPQAFTTLADFSLFTSGAGPQAALVQGTDGNFYGTTYGGVPNNGTVLSVTPAGSVTILYSFLCPDAQQCADGEQPLSGLVQASDGNFYGTTLDGGAGGEGTVFKITASGALTILYSFCSLPACASGSAASSLVQASDGILYGTTQFGGAKNSGTVFKITLSGALTTLYSFCSQASCADGMVPAAGLVQAADGSFYGTTFGLPAGYTGNKGTVFQITSDGALTTLYSFCPQAGCADGTNPGTTLIQASDGNLYGATSGGNGTIFRITPAGALTTLYSFCSIADCPDGSLPNALMQASDGNFYGTTVNGGATSGGTLYQLTPSGALTTLHSFCTIGVCADGLGPKGSLIQASDGDLYGTTPGGGTEGGGTVFRLTLGSGPPSPPPSILTGGVVNAASYAESNGAGSPVAPGSLVVIFTDTLSTQPATSGTATFPDSLSGVSVTFGGIPAPIVAVSPTGLYPYVSVQVPFEVVPASFATVLTVNKVPSAPVQTSIVASAPGIFTIPPTGQGNAILVFLSPSTNAPAIAAPSNASLGLATMPIPRGTTGFFYVTGLGAMTPAVPDGSGTCPVPNGLCNANAMPTVLVGGITAPVAFAGQAPGYPGVFQVNITVPQNAPTGNEVSLVVKSADGTVTSKAATIAVQ